jgi:hypothetical protein
LGTKREDGCDDYGNDDDDDDDEKLVSLSVAKQTQILSQMADVTAR